MNDNNQQSGAIFPPDESTPTKPLQSTLIGTLQQGIDTLQTSSDIGSTDLGPLTARVAALEAILAGYSNMALQVCSGGTAVTKTFLVK